MKRFLIRSTVFILTFVTTLLVAGRILNMDHDNMTMEMREATLPVITMLCEGTAYNQLHGNTVPMEVAYQREILTLLDENRSTQLRVDTYGREVTRIGAEVRSMDGSRLIENIEVTGYREEDGEIPLTISLKDLIEQQEEYVLVIWMELDGWEEVRYYTRIVWNPASHLKADLDFVLDFHEKLYHREEARELIRYLESNSRLEDNSSFHKVNIHSSFKQITWGDMKVTETVAPVVTLKELNSQSAMLLLDYLVSVAGENDDTYYRMQEYFRVKYTADRMYLLDYERTMTQIPDENDLYAGDKILMGIADENVSMMENSTGSVVAFTQENRLFSVDVAGQKTALLFSFYDREHMDARSLYPQHDIRILGVDDEGNVDFAVYGYMNRGVHEGQTGILISHYDAALNMVEELVYIPWQRSVSALRQQMQELLYLNAEKILYLSLDQSVYRADLKNRTYGKLFDVQWDESMQVSADHRILVWQEKGNQEYPSEIRVRDLESDTQTLIRGSYGEALKVLGFMNKDIIYGVAKISDITRSAAGQLVFPMYKLCICKPDGTLSKEYQQEGIWIAGCSVEENQITLERLKQKDNGEFIITNQDHITRTVQEEPGKNQVAVVDIDVYKRYVQIQVGSKLDAKLMQLLTPREVIHEGNDEMTLLLEKETPAYYVYGPYGVSDICISVGNAIEKAGTVAGTVTDERGRMIWQKGKRSSRNQIMAIKEPEKCSVEESLSVCLDTLLRYKGISVESAELLSQGKYALEILQENLTDVSAMDMTGCSLDAMLYYVNMDIPVLALLQSGEAVLITGFNESQVVIFQPSTGKLYKKSTSESSRWFEENGNCFLTYFP